MYESGLQDVLVNLCAHVAPIQCILDNVWCNCMLRWVCVLQGQQLIELVWSVLQLVTPWIQCTSASWTPQPRWIQLSSFLSSLFLTRLQLTAHRITQQVGYSMAWFWTWQLKAFRKASLSLCEPSLFSQGSKLNMIWLIKCSFMLIHPKCLSN